MNEYDCHIENFLGFLVRYLEIHSFINHHAFSITNIIFHPHILSNHLPYKHFFCFFFVCVCFVTSAGGKQDCCRRTGHRQN